MNSLQLKEEAQGKIDLSENNRRWLRIMYESYIMTQGGISPEVNEFVDWCIYESKRMIEVPRSSDGKSYAERASML